MYFTVTNFKRNVIIFLVLLGLKLTFCLGAEFFCEARDWERYNGTVVLVRCNLNNYTENGGFAVWRKDDVAIGRCYIQTVTVICNPYEDYKGYFVFGSCGPTCFTLGITQSLSSYYTGLYYIATDKGHIVRELALNLSLFYPNVASLGSTATILEYVSLSSIHNQDINFPLFTRGQNFESTESVLICSRDTSQTKATNSQEVTITSKYVLSTSVGLICTTLICFCFIGHKIYKYLKKGQLVIATKRPRSNDISKDGELTNVVSESVYGLSRESDIQTTMQMQRELYSYQELHQGPRPPPRTSHYEERNQEDRVTGLRSSGIAIINGDKNLSARFANDKRSAAPMMTFENSGGNVSNVVGQERVYEKKIFHNHPSKTSLGIFQDNGWEYEEGTESTISEWKKPVSCNIKTFPGVPSEGLAAMSVFGNPKESASCNVHYDMRILRNDDSNTHSKGMPDEEGQSGGMNGEDYLEMRAGYLVLE